MSEYRDDQGMVNPTGANSEGIEVTEPHGDGNVMANAGEAAVPEVPTEAAGEGVAAEQEAAVETASESTGAGTTTASETGESPVEADENAEAVHNSEAVDAEEAATAATEPTEAAATVTEAAESAEAATTAESAVAAATTAESAVAAATTEAASPASQPQSETAPTEPVPPVPEKRTPTWIKLLRTGTILAAIIGLFVFYYVTQSYQYEDTFMPGTFVNGNDVSGQTVEEVEEDIRARVEDTYSLTLTFRDGAKETIKPEEIGYRYVSTGEVEKAMTEQNPLTWVLRNMGQTSEIDVPENHTFDEKKLEAVVSALPEFQTENVVTPTNAYLNITDKNEFEIVPETQGNAPIAEAVIPVLKEMVTDSETEIDVTTIQGSYEMPAVTADNPDLVYQLDNLNKFLSTKITYKLPNDATKVIDRGTLINWVTRQDNGYYYLDDTTIHDNCAKFVAEIAAQVDERHTSIPFQSTNMGTINLSCAEYGRVIDQPGETEALFKDLKECTSEEKEPLYSLNKSVDPRFGGTYVEADLSNQHVYLYVDGQLIVDTPCVSGTKYESSRHTVLGLYSIYYKQRNRTLQGPIVNGAPSYTSFVNYWMPFYKGYGLHDASWRGSFGGTIYYYSGSHGCINLPYSAAATIYEHTEVGTPVIVFGGY